MSNKSGVNAVMQPLANMMIMVLVIRILTYGVVRVRQGTLTMGTLISFLLYLFQLLSPVIIISQLFNGLAKTSGSTERIWWMLNEPIEKASDDQKVDLAGEDLRLENVDFSYEEGKPILHNINVTAEPNTFVAFAGPSGGGKSTIFYFIERFYQPNSGKITVGGQRPADCHRQSLLRDSKILILDEATASLDSEYEAMVQKALASLMKKTHDLGHRAPAQHDC